MRRVAALLLAAASLVASSVPAVAGSDASSIPDIGALRAVVFVNRGRSVGSGGSCRWQPSWGDTALDNSQGHVQMSRLVGGIRQLGYERLCPGESIWRFFWVGPGNPPSLAWVARDELLRLVPKPTPAGAPAFDRGLVGLDTWIWTTTPWAPVSATAWVPTGIDGRLAWSTATASPTTLTFDPGDGTEPVVCDGPGARWTEALGDEAVSDCMVRFSHSSAVAANGRTFTATVRIDWLTAWVGSSGAGGTLAPITTSATVDVTVGEIQAVVTNG